LHLLTYTIVPALMLMVAATAVYRSWDPGAPLDGGWSARQLTVGPGMALLGIIVILAGQVAGRANDLDDAARPRAWIPLVTILVGIALLAVGVTALGRTVKRASAVHSG
jgi:H+/Cl- antiporter ClcA